MSLLSSYETSPNITTGQSICDKRLLELGQLSREGYNATITNNICPDSIFTPIFASGILIFYIVLVCFGVFGVYWKRNSGHVKARHATFMILTIVASFMCVLLTCLRYIVGRKVMPCFLYSISIFITPPAICLPTVLRYVRTFFLYRLNLKKAANVRASKEFYIQKNTELEKEEVKSPTRDVQVDLTFNNEENNKENNELNKAQSEQELNITSNSSVEKSDIDSNSEGLDQAYLDYSESAMFSKSFKILNFILSNKFIVLVYILAFGFHLAVWAIFGGVDEILWNTSGKRIFLWSVSMFQFDTGCVTTTNGVILMVSEAAFYIILEFVFFILLFFVDRDTWSIKIEAIVMIIIQIILAASFLISGQIEVIRFFTDYIVPYGFAALLYPILEILISVILPVIYAIRQDRKSITHEGNQMEILLRNRETFWLILDYARRSYCPENILAYKDIENFKKISKKNRKQVALKIINTYLVHDSPLELNIPNASTRYHEINTFLTGLVDDNVPLDLFDDIKLACLTNMTDIFERLKSSNLEFKQKVESLNKGQ
ncbi:predicted protein [Naegleria gruberi]|uniref:Predicted protein n=1 Tax=Naegleria gruberi TaxID=5762 RepID=D2VT35_NAEGR|nr:uncharacterized protein NAEGRDRAFT_72159 [Naegleria gruberi]EFC40015.1 predicted protein [Naegleria gruberi]|eukprot:XP_002672759.1 predicted protein [Naegleria gruberi strain NEG-M]